MPTSPATAHTNAEAAVPSRRRRSASRALGIASVALLAAVGCRSTDPAFLDSEERPLEELAPVLYSVAVAPLDLAGLDLRAPDAAEEPLRVSLSPRRCSSTSSRC
jgi:hypothetical protein